MIWNIAFWLDIATDLHQFNTSYHDTKVKTRAVTEFDLRGSVAQGVACLTRNEEVVGSSPIKGPRNILEQETLPLLLSTGWFQE